MRPIPTALTSRELSVLEELASDAAGPVLELGAQFGASTVTLARACRHRIHSVDWHLGDDQAGPLDTLWAFLLNLELADVRARVVVYVGRFGDVLPLLRDGSFAGAFVDGAHDFASVRDDVQTACRLVTPGGWVAVHDFGRFDVCEALEAVDLERESLTDTLFVGRAPVAAMAG